MENGKITDKYYKEAVAGMSETILNDKDLWYIYVLSLPLRLQIVYTIVVFHQQVYNGGLHQYFFNPYGQFAYTTVKHLKLIKAFQAANILEKAIRDVNIDGLNIDEFRAKIFNRTIDRVIDFDENLLHSLDLLDDEYDNLNEDLDQLLVDYVESR